MGCAGSRDKVDGTVSSSVSALLEFVASVICEDTVVVAVRSFRCLIVVLICFLDYMASFLTVG